MVIPIPADPAAEAAGEAPASEAAAEAAAAENHGATPNAQRPTPNAQGQAAATFGDTRKTAREIWNGEGSQADTIALMNAIERGEIQMEELMPGEDAEVTGGQGEGVTETEEADAGDGPSAEGAEDEAAEAEGTGGQGDEVKQPRRIKPAGSAEDRARIIALNDLMREEGIPLTEAIARLGFAPVPAAEAAEAGVVAKPPSEPKADPVKTARDKLAGLVKQKAEAAAEYDHKKVAEMEMEIEDARMDYAEANRAVQARSSKAHEAQRAADAAAIAQVAKAVPEFNDPASPLAKAAVRLETVLEKGDPEFFTRPRPKGETWASELFRMAWAHAYPHQPMPSLEAKPAAEARAGLPALRKPALPVPVLPKKNGASAASMLGNGAQRTTEVNSLEHVFDDPNSTREQRIEAANRLEKMGRR